MLTTRLLPYLTVAVPLREINRGGLLLIYQILVDTSQTDIARALQLITASLEKQQPCMFFCKLGKDRTGLIAALVLSACGVSEDEIIADYVRQERYGTANTLIHVLHDPLLLHRPSAGRMACTRSRWAVSRSRRT